MSRDEKDLELGNANAATASSMDENTTEKLHPRSLAGSSTDVEDRDRDREGRKYRHKQEHDDASSHYDHGEPDDNHEEAEETVPGHELDRELSRVRDMESIRRIESRHTIRSKVYRVFSRASRKKDELQYEALPETNLEEGIVGWDSQHDPDMPLNFAPTKKWTLVALISAITLVTPFASSILSPGIGSLMVDFNETNSIIGSMTVVIYLLGYVVGPMVMAPLSEIYGRRIVLTVANVFFCCWQIGCALAPNISALIVFRFFSGVGGAGCLTLGGAVIGDLFRPDQRGFAMGMWTLGPLFGPIIGPLIGGYIAMTIGWRWDFWIVLILAVIITVLIEVLNKETSHKILIQRKVARLRKELGRDDLKSCYVATEAEQQSMKRVLLNGFLRPLKMLVLSPIVLLLSLYIAFTYGTLYLLFTTIPTTFEETYGFSIGTTGLVYLSMGTGTFLGWIFITLYSDKTVIRLAKSNNGVFEPEMRLALTIGFGFFLPITFFWYGWCAEYKVHFMATILSLFPFGLGIMGLFLPITTYLVDCYPMYASSALAANTELRSLIGALLPLAGPPMYTALGLGWGNSLLGFICCLMIPLPIIFYRYGKRLREMQRFTL